MPLQKQVNSNEMVVRGRGREREREREREKERKGRDEVWGIGERGNDRLSRLAKKRRTSVMKKVLVPVFQGSD